MIMDRYRRSAVYTFGTYTHACMVIDLIEVRIS